MQTRLASLMSSWLRIPDDPRLIDEHRRTVLFRTRVAAWIAAVVMPVTVLGFLHDYAPSMQEVGLLISAAAVAGALVCLLLARTLEARWYHLPFFLLVGVVCPVVEVVVLELTGGGTSSNFFFPYFLIFFGIAALFPSRAGWSFTALLMSPLTYVIAEYAVNGVLPHGRAESQLLMLLDYVFIAAIANRVTTRIFFNEVETRQNLEAANAQLRELDEAKRNFFANISHDLRSPLTVIAGPLKALSSDADKLDPRQRRYLEFALRGTARLDSMITDLLELARIEAGAAKLNTSRLNIDDLLDGIVESLAPYAATQDLTLKYEGPSRPVYALVDGDKIERVVMNLVSNAIKFSPAGATVSVSLEASPRGLAISVTDEGVGISAEDLDRIFKRFTRGKDEQYRQIRGTGLGLSVVREFVELHGGSVQVRSERARGSTFTVLLPPNTLIDAPTEEEPTRRRTRHLEPHLLMPSAKPHPETAGAGGRPRLLIVEDSAEAQRFLSEELGGEFELVAALDAKQALREALARPPDLVLLDVFLGDSDGVEVCAALRKQPSTADVAILMASSRGDVATRLRCFEAGADDFLAKPFDTRELVARLRALERRAHGHAPRRPPGAGKESVAVVRH